MLPDRMHAVLLTRHGDLTALQYRSDISVPAPQTGEVLVRVTAAALNNTDVNLRIGWYSKSAAASASEPERGRAGSVDDGSWSGTPVPFPLIQGTDACGQIVAVGSGIPAGRVGERVLIDPVLRPAAGSASSDVRYLGCDCNGAFAQFVAVPATNAFPIRAEELSDAELASFPCAYVTAENMLTRAQISSADTLLVTGASGGVGSAAVQLARRRGARVIAIAAAGKEPALKSLGAETVVARGEDLVQRIGAESVDAVIDVVGGTAFAALLQVLRRGGRYAVAGAIGGPRVDLDLRTLYLKDLTLHGCTVPLPQLFERLVGYIERGEIRPIVAKIFRLQDLAEAQQAFLDKAYVGKIVVLP